MNWVIGHMVTPQLWQTCYWAYNNLEKAQRECRSLNLRKHYGSNDWQVIGVRTVDPINPPYHGYYIRLDRAA